MEPDDMYGKVMSMADSEIVTYLMVCTRAPLSQVQEAGESLANGTNPRDIKMRLAKEIVSMYHSIPAAIDAENNFIETFQKGNVPDVVESINQPYADALIEHGIVASKTELRRLLDAGGVRNAETGEKYAELPSSVAEEVVVKIGKRRFVKLLP